MPNFQNTEIYKIVNEEETFCYVGSTTDFRRRRYNHKRSCNNENDKRYNSNLYKTIRENGGWEKFKFESIENYPCNNHREQFLREQHWINELKPNLNMVNAQTDMKEYHKMRYQNNKEERQKYNKEYYQNNKEELKEKCKEYQQNHKEEKKERDKEYHQNHKEEISQKKKEYYEQNKEELKEKHKEKFQCDCGSVVTIWNRSRHNKTKKHQDFLNKQN